MSDDSMLVYGRLVQCINEITKNLLLVAGLFPFPALSDGKQLQIIDDCLVHYIELAIRYLQKRSLNPCHFSGHIWPNLPNSMS